MAHGWNSKSKVTARHQVCAAGTVWLEVHLQEIVAVLQYSDFLQRLPGSGLSDWATKTTSLAEHSRHSCPPESCAGILATDNDHVQQESIGLPKREHQVLLWLESVLAIRSSTLVTGIFDKLAASVHLIVSISRRLMMDAFEAGGYQPASVAGIHLLNCLLCTFPNTKLVEDAHNDIPRDCKFQPNKKQTMNPSKKLLANRKSLTAVEFHM